mmetsp:Transcript_42260/g.100343  ORF Transcript_42260/g.100343 Transcript_42260/m.100343 type:complete len:243 (-) Transcript_42260:220-948(-)
MPRSLAPQILLAALAILAAGAEGVGDDGQCSSRAAELVKCPQCRFTTDGAANNAPLWAALMRPWSRGEAGREIDVLDVGSWEGLSALWFAKNLRVRSVTCVDSWEGGGKDRAGGLSSLGLGDLEARFDHNIASAPLPGPVSLVKLKGLSNQRLAGLVGAEPGRLFDLVYLDGARSAEGVLSDFVMALHLLAPGGVLIVDDIGLPGVEEVVNTVAGAHGEVRRTPASECPAGQACFRKSVERG